MSTNGHTEDELISSFCELTGTGVAEAREHLTANNFDLDGAITTYFADQEDLVDPTESASANTAVAPEPEYTGPRTLDGRPAPQSAIPSTSRAAAKKPARRTGLTTLGDLKSSEAGPSHGHGHDHSDDDNDDSDGDGSRRREPRDLFAGGEKSGLAVQDPADTQSKAQKVIKDILAQARANAKRNTESGDGAGPATLPSASRFQGSGQTLGGEGVESRVIPDPRAARSSRAPPPTGPTQERSLHLWNDGFSIDDGPLRRFDDPQHAADLRLIRQGRAPVHLMDVEPGQTVDVKLQQHDEDWHQLPKVYRPFGGTGNRLGSPVPGASSSAPVESVTQASSAASSGGATQPSAPEVDSSQPTIMIRFQMPDGSRLPARFNTTARIGDLYDFARSASPDTRARAFVIQSTFPSKEFTDLAVVLSETDAFKRGGTAVVKWA